jgi:4-oxalocrotonate tautomerase
MPETAAARLGEHDGRPGNRRRRHASPIVTVEQSPHDTELKRRVVAGITEAFVDAYGIAAENVQLFIREVDHDWAKAGILASGR